VFDRRGAVIAVYLAPEGSYARLRLDPKAARVMRSDDLLLAYRTDTDPDNRSKAEAWQALLKRLLLEVGDDPVTNPDDWGDLPTE